MEYREHDSSYLLVGRVASVDPANRSILMVDCISSPGVGVGYSLDPTRAFHVDLNIDAKLPVVGQRIACHQGQGWWMDTANDGDLDTFLTSAAGTLDTLLLRASTIRERYDEIDAEHDMLSQLIYRLAAAHVASVPDDDGYDE